MDLQTHLKAILKNKYQMVNGIDDLLPINVSNRNLEVDTFPDFNQHYCRHIDHSDLHTYVVYPPFPFKELLSCNCKHGRSQRTILTVGACGVGKTTAVQRCVLDWAEDKAHKHIDLLFPLSCWELCSLDEDLKVSLVSLLQMFYPELKELSPSSLCVKKVWIVLDDLDDLGEMPSFFPPKVSDVTKLTSLNIILSNLINGNLLPNAHIWITARHAVAHAIPHRFLLKQTEVQGFNDEQKELHIRKLVGDDHLADRVMDHIKISRSLHYFCRIPHICTIMATVLKKHVKAGDYKIRPMSLTQIYSSLIADSHSGIVSKLKAFALNEGHDMAYHQFWIPQDELIYWKIEAAEASAYARNCPLVFTEVKGLCGVSIFRFAHLSILEFLMASAQLHKETTSKSSVQFSLRCQKAVEVMLDYPDDGHYDVCLRFFFGLIKEQGALQISDPFFAYFRRMTLENIFNYKAVMLFHCLREFNSEALLNEVKYFQKTGLSPLPGFHPVHWQLAMQRTTNFEGVRELFEMELSTRCDQKVLHSLPAILKSRKAMLRFSDLSDACCPALASVLATRESYLRELDLGYNSISDRGVESLLSGLSDQACGLKSLRLQACELTSAACEHLATALKQSPKLRELDLSCNNIGDVGLQHLAMGLETSVCRLETLRLSQCNIKREGCSHLASALEKRPSFLKWLDLSINKIGNKAINELLTKFDISKLRKLELYYCGLTARCCQKIGEALKDENSNLVELNLSSNNLKDAGVYWIGDGMFAWSRVEKLNLSRCGITAPGCRYLSKILACISSLYSNEFGLKAGWQAAELKELDLSMNKLTDDGVKDIASGLKNPYSNLRKLILSECSLTHDCCMELGSRLSTRSCRIAELDLSSNNIQDRGLHKLCVGLGSPECVLQKLYLRNCGLSPKCVSSLLTALKTNLHLSELFVMGNNLDEATIEKLSWMTKSNAYVLQTVDVSTD